MNRNTAAYYFQRLRDIIAYHLEQAAHEVFEGEIEVDESYFDGTRKGKQGRGVAGKVPVFGQVKRGGKVYTKIIVDANGTTLLLIIEHKVIYDSIVYSDCRQGYNALDVSGFKHYRTTTQSYFRMVRIISIVLSTFGIKPSAICVSLMVYLKLILGCFEGMRVAL